MKVYETDTMFTCRQTPRVDRGVQKSKIVVPASKTAHVGKGGAQQLYRLAQSIRLDFVLNSRFSHSRLRHSLRLSASDQLRQRDGGVAHTVGEAPLVVVPGEDTHEGAVDHLGLVEVEH